MSITCSRCGTDNRDNAPNCINCGAPLSAAIPRETPSPVAYQKPCINCNRMINPSLAICPYCGANQFVGVVNKYPGIVGQQHNKLVTSLLAIFLGTFGAHKFYLGQTFQGFLYLVFFWTGVPTIVGIIEGLVYLSMDDNSFYQKYG